MSCSCLSSQVALLSKNTLNLYISQDCLFVCDGQCKSLSLPLFCSIQRCLRLQLPAGPLHGQPLPLPQLLRLHEALLRRAANVDLPCLCCFAPPHIHSIALLLPTGLKPSRYLGDIFVAKRLQPYLLEMSVKVFK